MGELYGNITTLNRTHFQFDKIYSSRSAMDSALTTDDIFAGRFVLVQYSQNQFSEGDILLGYKQSNDNTIYIDPEFEYPLIYVALTHVSNPQRSQATKYYYNYAPGCYFHLPSQDYYDVDQTSNYYTPSGTVDWENSYRFITTGQMIKTVRYIKVNSSTNEQENANNYDSEFVDVQYYRCTGGNNNNPTFESIAIDDTNQYYVNYQIDKARYGQDTSFGPNARGYDGTVWQKVYNSGVGSYELIAHLNAMIPQFDLVADPPSEQPSIPYIDAESADAFYRIHSPGRWGFRIKQAESQNDPVNGTTYPYSDQKVIQDYYTYSTPNNTPTGPLTTEIDADIYFNAKARDKLYNYRDNSTQNEIKLSPSGKSGKWYYKNGELQQLNDTYELSIHLPAIGNMISDGYDLIYGSETNASNQRPTDIQWYTADASDTLKTNGNSSLGGKTHNLNSLAGSLNTMHDIIGQIVYPLQAPPNETQIDNNLNENYLYYYGGQYYRKGLIMDKTLINSNEFSYISVGQIAENDFVSNKYYTKSGNNYIEATEYISGTTYYIRNINSVRYTSINLTNFAAGSYYLLDGENYTHDNNTYPTYPTRTYYTLQASDPIHFNGQYQAGRFYIKNNGNYYLSQSTTPEINETYYGITERTFGGPQRFYHPNSYYYKENDMFFLDDGQTATRDTYYVLTFKNTPLYGYDSYGNVIQYYEIDYYVEVPRLSFATPPTSFNNIYMKDENNNYISYENIKDIQLSYNGDPYTVYRQYYQINTSGNDTNIIEYASGQLYLPGSYYIRENNTYIKSYNSWTSSLTNYYTLSNISPVTTQFYIPNVYYYFSGGEYLLASGNYVSGRTYYEKTAMYVENDTTGQCPYGYEWSDYSTYIPPSITLFTASKQPGLIPLSGLGENTESLYGLILLLNKMYAPTEEVTRDITSVRGMYNTLRDILYQIKTLKPGNILYVNDFGQIESMELQKLKTALNNV